MNIKAPLTFVAFWDPHCSHCQLQIPRLDSFYEAKWKNEGVKIFAVCVNDYVVDDWKKFIVEHKLNGWYHAYETKEKKHSLKLRTRQITGSCMIFLKHQLIFYWMIKKELLQKALVLTNMMD